MKKTLLALALALAAGGAQAIPLSDLLAGATITANDKLFDQWTLIYFDSSDPARVFNGAQIDVQALTDGGLDPGPGLRFTVSGDELTIDGNGTYAYIDLMFGFRVSVLDPKLRIKDNSLDLYSAFYVYAWDPLHPGAYGPLDVGSYIRETIGTAQWLDDLGVKDVQFSFADGVGQTVDLSDHADFAPQSVVYVTKNILVWASATTDVAGIWGFDQRFSQVPEPATLGLLGLGLAGLGFARLRRTA